MISQMGDFLRSAPLASPQQVAGYPTLFILVALGSLVPVVPTGALVSSAAVVAFHHTAPFALLLVFVVAASAAFVGDIALYWLGQRGADTKNGSRQLARLRRRAAPERLEEAQRKLAEHGVTVLIVSRLIPAGRIPVMVACLVARMPMRQFVRGDVPACLAWAVTYQVIGILGGSLFSEPWKGVVAVVALTLLISAAPGLWQRVTSRRPERAGRE